VVEIEKILIGFLLITVLIVSGCTSNSPEDSTTVNHTTIKEAIGNDSLSKSENSNPVDRVEVYHFHGTQQCYSCRMVGELAEKTVNTYFKEELESGKLVFGHINGDLSENRESVEEYGVTASSLWIGTYINGTFHKEQNTNVWYKIRNEEDYLTYLRDILEQRLAGDLS